MKMYLMKIAALGTLSILLASSVEATDPHWKHTILDRVLPGQGVDGTYWGNIGGTKSNNSAEFVYPYAECAIGSHQSPIAINLTSQAIETNPKAEPERRADSLVVQYTPSMSSTGGKEVLSKDEVDVYVFRNTGHAVQVSFSKGYHGRLLIGQDVYPLVQFHFHTPSEHRLIKGQPSAGQEYGSELHFVHQREDGKLAVLGVLLDAQDSAADNSILKNIIDYTPPNEEFNEGYNTTGAGLRLDPSKLIPMKSEHVFTYAGSLTTPPCSEGVSWYVLSEPLKVARGQIEQLRQFIKLGGSPLPNNRIVQKTYSRTVNIHKDLHVDQDGDSRLGR